MRTSPITGAIADAMPSGQHRRTSTTDDRHWAIRYVVHAHRPAQHHMTRATRRRVHQDQLTRHYRRIPAWQRLAHVMATWVL
jgi:hypothetical protein